jgi:hypothetical protein
VAVHKKDLGLDRQEVAAAGAYEVDYFKRKHGLTTEEAAGIIKHGGNSREEANAPVQKTKK